MSKDFEKSGEYCAWCGGSLPDGCECGFGQPSLPTIDWERVKEVFGPEGMPSCGCTDARRLGSISNESGTTFIGGDDPINIR